MNTSIIKIDPEKFESDTLRLIAGVLKKEGMIVYPTDTFYGLGADCYSPSAVERIYALKKRDVSKAISVLAGGPDMVKACTIHRPDIYGELAENFWPGPLTLVMEASPQIPKKLLAGGRTLGIRWPDCPWINELIKLCGFPITATSANLSGQSEISRADDAIEIFCGRVDCIVDGGSTPGGKPSTVVDLTQEKPVILREGAVPAAELQPYLA